MSSNTTQRVVSALVLVLIVIACLVLGTKVTLGFVLVVGVLALDEIYCNFFKRKRFEINYFISQGFFIAPFIYFNFLEIIPHFFYAFINAGIVLNILLLTYLFLNKMESRMLLRFGDKTPFAAAAFLLLPLMALSSFFLNENWKQLVGVLLFINFGMDTGAWFFGKNFGKHKLWPKVSPKKTIEGLVGGSLTSGVVGIITWKLFFGQMSWVLFIVFCGLGILSQLGDLVQSKIKRQFNIKDSSNLIPGHGGVYDRIDSLLFLAPFYATFINYFFIK